MAANGYFWWIVAGVLIVLELMSGTFYLLMIASCRWPRSWDWSP
jgi:membrane protein implicated in regulation of membrane protease activity